MKSPLNDSQIARLLLFQGVNPVSIRHWIDLCSVLEYSPGTVILSPDEKNRNMYLLLEGQASIHLDSLENEPIAVAVQGECVGEMSVFDGLNPSAFVKTVTNTVVLVIERETLLTLIDHSHGVSRNLLYLLSSRLRHGNAAVIQSQRMQKEYEQHANIDVLTGLHNRRWINEYFKRILARASFQSEFPVTSLMLIDIDHFKQFNDTHGHIAGDAALRAVADALVRYIRPTDTAARYGGEEFLVLLPDTTAEQAFIAAERVRKGVESAVIEMNGQGYPGVTISLGITRLQKGDDLGSIITAADHALYEAKNSGRNRAVLASRV